MNTQDEVKNKLEAIFEKYKFTTDQQLKAVTDLIKVGETMVFGNLSEEMSPEQKISFQELFSIDMNEEKLKKIYSFLSKIFPDEKIADARDKVYEKLISDYIKHMNS